MSAAPLLVVDGLSVEFQTLRGHVQVLDRIDLQVQPGQIVSVVGESGSGKSVTALAIMGLLGDQGRISAGRVRLSERELTALGTREMLSVRGRDVSMVFQEPMTSLNPVFTVGFQIAEVLMEHLGLSRGEAMGRAAEAIEQVGIPDGASRVHHYPHQLSGGMRQRIMIAMALACRPQLLIADEPTTALDVTIQAQILDLMRAMRDELGTAVMLITHDMGVVADMADRVLVMYAGQVVEEAAVEVLFESPRHPYTALLLRSIPLASVKQARLPVIEGTTPVPQSLPGGCRFHPRCPMAVARCREEAPTLEALDADRRVRCWRHAEVGKMLPGAT